MGKKRTTGIEKNLLNDLRDQLKALDLELKPSYLWEISFGDCDHVFNVCRDSKVALNGLQVIQINDTIFIAKRPTLVEHLNYLLSDSFIWFVDVSPDLSFPQLLSEEQMKANKSLLRIVLNEINLNESNSQFKVDINEESMADMCLISGSLLGYPIVYSNREPQRGNCLSFETLSHIRLQMSNKIIYSFSYPHRYRSLFKQQINSWFESVKHRSQHQTQDLYLNEELMTLPLVLT